VEIVHPNVEHETIPITLV